jgi:hypothetical protein
MASITLPFKDTKYPSTPETKEAFINSLHFFGVGNVNVAKCTFVWDDAKKEVTASGEGVTKKVVDMVSNISDSTYKSLLTCFSGKFEVKE